MIANFFCSINFMSLLTTTSSYTMDTFGVSHASAGFAASLIVVGALAARVFAVRYTLAVGYRRMLFIGLAAAAATTFLYLFAGTFLIFCLIRFINGFAFGVSANTTITIVTTYLPKNRSGEGVGYFSLSQIVGTALGPYVAIQMIHGGGFGGVFLFAAIAPAAALPLLLLMKLPEPPETASADEERLPLIDKLIERKVLPVSALCFVIYFGFSSILSFVAVFTTDIGLERASSYFFVVYSVALIATRPFVSRLFDRSGPDMILYPGIAALAAGLLLLSRTGTDISLIIASTMFGIGLGAVQVGTLALVVGIAPRHRLAVANGTYYMSLDGATSVGPVITGLLIAAAGYRGMYFIMFIIVACCLLLYRALTGRIKSNLINQ